MYGFAALRFIEDENIEDRVYWYLTELALKTDDLVLAPVGAHNRLQLARVERTFCGETEDAPYDVRLLKKVEAKYGERKLFFGGAVCCELGGVRYDFKRYTRYSRILFTDIEELSPEAEKDAFAYGVRETVSSERKDALQRLARAEGCVLLYGVRAAEQIRTVLAAVRGGEHGLDEETASAFRKKLR